MASRKACFFLRLKSKRSVDFTLGREESDRNRNTMKISRLFGESPTKIVAKRRFYVWSGNYLVGIKKRKRLRFRFVFCIL